MVFECFQIYVFGKISRITYTRQEPLCRNVQRFFQLFPKYSSAVRKIILDKLLKLLYN